MVFGAQMLLLATILDSADTENFHWSEEVLLDGSDLNCCNIWAEQTKRFYIKRFLYLFFTRFLLIALYL
jgi:hypothetical protein